MTFIKLNKFNFRHMVLAITALTIMVLTLLVAIISAQVAFNEMKNTLYQQSVQFTKSLAEDSVAPLLYNSTSGAEEVLDTLVDLKQITAASIYHTSNNLLAQMQEPEHKQHRYPEVTMNALFKVIETPDGWYFSAPVINKLGAGNLAESILEMEEQSAITELGYINLGVSKVSIYASRKNIFIRNFLVTIFAGIILLSVMYFVLRNITRPLETLSALMEQGRQGNYPEYTEISGSKEIKEMSHTFNEMIVAIKEREQNLSLTLNSIGDAVIATDAKGRVMRMNPVAENLTGWSLEQARGKSVKTVFPIIDASTRQSIQNPVERVLSSGETVHLSNHTTLISKDKIEYQIADSAAPICNEDGDVLGMVLVFNDVTEQYKLRQDASKSKRDMQAVMDNSPAVIYVKDINGRYQFVNKRFEKLFNMGAINIIGKTDYDIFPEEFAKNFTVNDKAVIESGFTIESEENVPQEDGMYNYMSVKFPLFDNEENIYAVCGISTDITDRKKQEQQLRQAQKMDALGKLTGGIAHDFNNMLGVVMGYADLLQSQLDKNSKLAGFAQNISHAGERGARLTQKLLAFSKLKQVDASELNINKLLLDERDMLEKVITARIQLKLNLADDIWPVFLDEGDLEDAIVNLCINSMHAIEGNGQLTIGSSNVNLNTAEADIMQLSEGDYIRMSITDTGCGMDELSKDKIFEPFYTTKGEKGTGLGLAQVYGFVERSNGAIQVYSELQQGTEFVFYFPRYHQKNNIIDTQHKSEKSVTGGVERILIVDDEPALLELVNEILSEKGYITMCANNAKMALNILQHSHVDVLLSDIIMPGMDGYELARVVREKYPKIKIQLASGFSDERYVDAHDDDLHKSLLHKPYHSHILLKRIRDLLLS